MSEGRQQFFPFSFLPVLLFLCPSLQLMCSVKLCIFDKQKMGVIQQTMAPKKRKFEEISRKPPYCQSTCHPCGEAGLATDDCTLSLSLNTVDKRMFSSKCNTSSNSETSEGASHFSRADSKENALCSMGSGHINLDLSISLRGSCVEQT